MVRADLGGGDGLLESVSFHPRLNSAPGKLRVEIRVSAVVALVSRPTILVSVLSFLTRSELRVVLLSPSRWSCPCNFLSSCHYHPRVSELPLPLTLALSALDVWLHT